MLFDFRIAGFSFPGYLDSIKTTIDIPDAALADAMRFTGAKTKREAVVKALEEFNRQQLVKEFDAECWQEAARVARICLRSGVNVPFGDILISACARRYGVELLERDRHFAMIRKAMES
jgi:predicted nucleic acid-binding protein